MCVFLLAICQTFFLLLLVTNVYICSYVRMCVCIYICVSGYISAYGYTCVYVYIYVNLNPLSDFRLVAACYRYIYVCMYVLICIRMYLYDIIYTYATFPQYISRKKNPMLQGSFANKTCHYMEPHYWNTLMQHTLLQKRPVNVWRHTTATHRYTTPRPHTHTPATHSFAKDTCCCMEPTHI